MSEHPPYPVGLRLSGRRVVVVGGGHVAQRRVPTLIAAGADVLVVSPQVTPAIEGMAGEISIRLKPFEADDLDDAWYAMAVTDRSEVNAAVVAAAEERRIFCVRSDDARTASAWTPASGRHDGLTVAVLANRDPRRSAAVRDSIVAGLRDGVLSAPGAHDPAPGVVLVGGGPGDPELTTVAARHALASADVVVADRLAPRELLDELGPEVELIDVAKLPRGRAASQDEINRVIVERALAGVPVTVVPGLSSPLAVPAVAGIPVTHRGVAHEFTVVSGHLPPGHPDSLVDYDALARLDGTLLLMMAVQNAPAIAQALLEGGRPADTPVAVVCDGTLPGERTVLATLGTLGTELEASGVRPPAIIVIGRVVAVAHPQHFA